MIAALVTVAALAGPGSARASDPVSIYVVPRLVEQSAGTPARVAIHGAFFQLTSATALTYGAPQCGVMYFQCAPGDETLCRMQWGELATAAMVPSPTICSGFGSLHVISTATLRQEGAALATPDTWDLGLGIGQGVYVDGKCPLALALACPPPGADGGATDGATMIPGSGGSTGSAGGAGVPGSGGASGTGGATIPPGSGGATPASGGAAPPQDAGASGGAAGQPGTGGKGSTTPPPAHRSGCAVGGVVPECPLCAAVAAVMAFAVMAGRRRDIRRRR